MQFATANRNVIGCRLSSVMSTWLTSNKICKRNQCMPVGCQTGTNLPSAEELPSLVEKVNSYSQPVYLQTSCLLYNYL